MNPHKPMNFYNRVLDKKGLKRIVSWFIENYGPTRTSLLLDDFKYLGFHYAGQAGLSLGFDDLRIPTTKKYLLATAQQQVQTCEKTYLMGRITAFERYQKLIDIWTTTSEKLKEEVIQNFEKIQGGPLASPLYMMAFSGARGNISQVRQLVGMRGLMSDSGGGIIDFPIRSNFREGLSVTEYVISCYGARKGLIDTALRTADSGYLTRRLVDVAHGIIIREIDCGSWESISMKVSDTKNLLGRVLAETVTQTDSQPHSSLNRNKVIWRNQEISVSVALELKTLKGSKASVQVRSPLTCLSQSVCQLCYGWNLAQGRLVSLGEAVGILAAQSIGEPGTQLTMRTFHTGGIFSTEVEDKLYSPQDGHISIYSSKEFRGCKIRSVHGQTAFFFFDSIQLKIKSFAMEKEGENTENLSYGSPLLEKESILELPAQSILFLSPGNKIGKNTLFAEISRIKQPSEKLQETQNKEKRKLLNDKHPPLTKSGNLSSTREALPDSVKSGDLGKGGLVATKKVFSEIQGEVRTGTTEENRKSNKNNLVSATQQRFRLVFSGEPFVFNRKENSTPKHLPFRTGDLFYWKGKRKSIKKSIQVVESSVSLPSNQPLEIRRTQTMISEENKASVTAKKLVYSGLILRLDHQKEIQGREERSSGGVGQAPRPQDLRSGGAEPPQARELWGGGASPQPPQAAPIGKICQPYVLLSRNKNGGINTPTQIIRKRENKYILRHVQPHLGADIQIPEKSQKNEHPSSLEEQKLGSGQRGTQPSLPVLHRYVKQRDLLFQLVLPISQSSSSSDIVQGLPKIEQLFEARNPIRIQQTTDGTPPNEKQIPQEETKKESKTDLRNLQKRLIQEIQLVYNAQGVEIADKHLEIIVRQMTSRIRILEKGNTPFFPEDIVEGVGASLLKNAGTKQSLIEDQKEKHQTQEGDTHKLKPFCLPSSSAYEWVLLGITKVALLATTESYISAASFQETKRVLMNSALQNRVDFFEGLKENVIVGRMIPAGTGYSDGSSIQDETHTN